MAPDGIIWGLPENCERILRIVPPAVMWLPANEEGGAATPACGAECTFRVEPTAFSAGMEGVFHGTRKEGDREDASSMATAGVTANTTEENGATANTTEENSRASRESGLVSSHSHGQSIEGLTPSPEGLVRFTWRAESTHRHAADILQEAYRQWLAPRLRGARAAAAYTRRRDDATAAATAAYAVEALRLTYAYATAAAATVPPPGIDVAAAAAAPPSGIAAAATVGGSGLKSGDSGVNASTAGDSGVNRGSGMNTAIGGSGVKSGSSGVSTSTVGSSGVKSGPGAPPRGVVAAVCLPLFHALLCDETARPETLLGTTRAGRRTARKRRVAAAWRAYATPRLAAVAGACI